MYCIWQNFRSETRIFINKIMNWSSYIYRPYNIQYQSNISFRRLKDFLIYSLYLIYSLRYTTHQHAGETVRHHERLDPKSELYRAKCGEPTTRWDWFEVDLKSPVGSRFITELIDLGVLMSRNFQLTMTYWPKSIPQCIVYSGRPFVSNIAWRT